MKPISNVATGTRAPVSNAKGGLARRVFRSLRPFVALFVGVCLAGWGTAFAQTVDVQISGMSLGSPKANAGGSWSIPVTYTVTNIGTVAAPSSWSDIGYLSAHGVLDNNSQSNSYLHSAGALAAGASYTAAGNFTTSTSTTPGAYTFFVKTDGHNASYTGGTNTDNGNIAEAN